MLIDEIKSQLSQEFEMKDLGELHYCLGPQVWREYDRALIAQSKYTSEILKRSNMSECKAVSTHVEQNAKLSSDDETKEVNVTLYHHSGGKFELSHNYQTRHSIFSQHP